MNRLTKLPALKQILVLLVSLGVIVVAVIFTLNLVLSSAPRTLGNASIEGITVAEFAQLPDNDSYPYAVAVAPDGTIYTGSYASGTVWSIALDGEVTELPDTREQVGSVTGLDVALDGTLYILDRIAPLEEAGGIIWRMNLDGTLESLVTKENAEQGGFILPEDIAIDGTGQIYVSDRGPDQVWRFDANGENGTVWWTSPELSEATNYAPTGLAYDTQHEALLITDNFHDVIYRVPIESDNPRDDSDLLYRHVDRERAPGFDGITITEAGDIYVAGIGLNRIYRWNVDGLVEIAKDFRQSSDVAFDGTHDLLYVTNFNSAGLAIRTSPQLPFALDVVDLSPAVSDE